MKIRLPDSLTAENSENYNLSIRLWADGFAFSGYIPGNRDSFFYETAPVDSGVSCIDALKNIFFENDWMKYVYHSVELVCVTEKYTMVPEDVFVEKGKEVLLSFCLNPDENSRVIAQHIEGENFVLLYELNSEVYEFLVRSFMNVHFVHFLSPLLKIWQKSSLEAHPKHIYIYVRKGMADIACFKRGELIFANSFPCEREYDLLYFVTYVSKQIIFNQLKDKMFFCGETASCDAVIKVLNTYMEHITLFPRKMENYKMPADQEVPYDITILTECGL